MKLTIVRHGKTHANVEGFIEGHLQGKLNEEGLEQAKKLGKRLEKEHFDIIYVSDLDRTIKTAEAITCFHPTVKVNYVKDLRERHFGNLEGKHKDELLAVKKQVSDATFLHFKPDEGESLKEVQERIIFFYENLLENHMGQSVLVVSHAGTITSLLLHLLQKDMDIETFSKFMPDNTALTKVEIDDDKKHTVHLLNCTTHLD